MKDGVGDGLPEYIVYELRHMEGLIYKRSFVEVNFRWLLIDNLSAQVLDFKLLPFASRLWRL